MSVPRRKVVYYLLELQGTESPDTFADLDRGLANHSKIDDHRSNTFYYADSVNGVNGMQAFQILFINSKYNHSPDYVNRLTLASRQSSKGLDEGEKEKTHAVLVFDGSRALLAVEARRNGTPISKAVLLIEDLLRSAYDVTHIFVDYTQLMSGDFWAKLSQLNRVMKLTVTTKVSIRNVGEPVGRVLSQSPNVNENIAIHINAKRGRSLRDIVRTIYRALGRSEVISIKADGKDDANNAVSILLDQVTDTMFMDVVLSADGTVDSSDFFPKLTRQANSRWSSLPAEGRGT
jgi:hypothetical protein